MDSPTASWDILIVDPLAEDRYHLIEDDLFLATCLTPLARRFLIATSTTSAANIRSLGIAALSTHAGFPSRRFIRLQLVRNILSLTKLPHNDVIFQSFEEVSTLVFMLLNPSKRVHLIVTNNLRPDRIRRHPWLGRLLLQAVIKRATSIIVHCEHEVARIRELAPGVDKRKVFVKPFHQISQPREILPLEKKGCDVLFLGPEQPHKSVGPMIQLMNADASDQFRYVFCSMAHEGQTNPVLPGGQNVEVMRGYTEPAEYYRRFSGARVVLLTHDANFEGALSGAFCDAIASGTPVVARRMAPHDEFFARFGPMGFLVDYDTPEWYAPLLNGTLSERYNEFQQNMAACRAACNGEAIREVFRTLLHRSQMANG